MDTKVCESVELYGDHSYCPDCCCHGACTVCGEIDPDYNPDECWLAK